MRNGKQQRLDVCMYVILEHWAPPRLARAPLHRTQHAVDPQAAALDVYESNKVNERSQVPCAMNDNERGEKDDCPLSVLSSESPVSKNAHLSTYSFLTFLICGFLDLRAFGVTRERYCLVRGRGRCEMPPRPARRYLAS